MKIISFLLRNSRSNFFIAIIAGVISGVANTGLLALITATLSSSHYSRSTLVWGFVALCLIAPLTRILSELVLIHLGQQAVFELRKQLSQRILAIPLRQLEEIGPHRLTVALTDDVNSITGAIIFIPILCINIAVVIGCLIYLGMLSWTVFLAVLGSIVLGVISYQLPVMKAMRYLRLAREEEDKLFGHFRALVEGFKEFKIHRERRRAFLSEELQSTATAFRQHNITGMAIYTIASSWGQLLVFIVIGLLLFVMPNVGSVSALALTGYTLTILYMMTPLQVIMNTLPNIGRANVALNKVEELGLTLAAHPDTDGASTDEATTRASQQAAVESLELKGVTHTYHLGEEENNFILGPLDLSFRGGEVVFLIGGNGSGKTSLAKLLLGLYTPETGEILLNGRPVTDENREDYRQHFSAVFADFYLFEKLLGLESSELETKARDFLVRLQLDHKVQLQENELSTIKLSQGQRKRLALLTAYLEDRPIYLFDEWAADQDPGFKEMFYLQLLPELKARGKTVFVISHDDHYYSTSDRLIKLDYGQVESDLRPTDAAAGRLKRHSRPDIVNAHVDDEAQAQASW
ncbi:MAG: cyclic peptide export ABC transporter [Pyrinomonadaceae bacterium]